MKPNEKFLKKPKSFWASVRSISQVVGYSKDQKVIAAKARQMVAAFRKLKLGGDHLTSGGSMTEFAQDLEEYFEERAHVLSDAVEPKLMNAAQAESLFDVTWRQFDHKCPVPMNKQKGEKRAKAFFSALVNIMVERHAQGLPCDYDPRRMTTITRSRAPLRTMSRRVDGAFPSTVNPIAIWEIKEYYYTTTFGSRIADGVYETLLDGMEIEELREHEDISVKHYLMVDGYRTWWEDGKSYLCRLFDMLHMGYVDEVLFGREVVEEMPRIVGEWVATYGLRSH
ncbi:MAG: hypothetical protein F4Y87_04745 [Synechococcus sp. SB0665_bin_28]|nr:hypothetical protein [Synechococcus sp. SB0665_bin_28]MYF20377.1 hypothetical protein [Synechococcus sp. SB0677_bin_5]